MTETPAPPQGMELLRGLVELIAAVPAGGGVVGQRVCAAIASYEASGGRRDLGDCFGLKPPAGQSGWWTRELREKRGAKILEVDRCMFAGEAVPIPSARARAIRAHLKRYESDAWPRERQHPLPPDDPLRRLTWQLLKLVGDAGAPSESTIRRCLDAGDALSNALPFVEHPHGGQSPDAVETNATGRTEARP